MDCESSLTAFNVVIPERNLECSENSFSDALFKQVLDAEIENLKKRGANEGWIRDTEALKNKRMRETTEYDLQKLDDAQRFKKNASCFANLLGKFDVNDCAQLQLLGQGTSGVVFGDGENAYKLSKKDLKKEYKQYMKVQKTIDAIKDRADRELFQTLQVVNIVRLRDDAFREVTEYKINVLCSGIKMERIEAFGGQPDLVGQLYFQPINTIRNKAKQALIDHEIPLKFAEFIVTMAKEPLDLHDIKLENMMLPQSLDKLYLADFASKAGKTRSYKGRQMNMQQAAYFALVMMCDLEEAPVDGDVINREKLFDASNNCSDGIKKGLKTLAPDFNKLWT